MREITDRLLLLSTYRRLLDDHQFTSVNSVLNGTDERLERLQPHRDAIVKLVQESKPDILLALFPEPPISWRVVLSTKDADVRRLSVYRRLGPHTVDVIRECWYDGHDERAAWIALRDALRAAGARSAGTI